MIIVAGHLRVAPDGRDKVLTNARDAIVLARATPGWLGTSWLPTRSMQAVPDDRRRYGIKLDKQIG